MQRSSFNHSQCSLKPPGSFLLYHRPPNCVISSSTVILWVIVSTKRGDHYTSGFVYWGTLVINQESSGAHYMGILQNVCCIKREIYLMIKKGVFSIYCP
ncbi:hypothetical protein XELAEV_18019931mg [Xenopus laevis]|uniref:Uncharacterized protein n=1 Tax=Xenopus laevis TaxID=8355 RepID=A0A974HQ56_XENLA|nr:hypothetical protein XELAEV_18019931mg [Xenopus laevis]